MCRKYFSVCVVFSLWTIVQTSFHLVFVIYGYYLYMCAIRPTEASSIFFYLTYFYKRKCGQPVLSEATLQSPSMQGFFNFMFEKVYSDDVAVTLTDIVRELLNNTNVFPEESASTPRTAVYFLSYIVLDAIWIITAVALLMGVCFRVKESLSLFFYGPWLILTLCVSLFDVAASFQFGFDIPETTSFGNWFKFVGIEDTSNLQNLDSISPSSRLSMSPSITMCLVCARFIIIWIINIGGIFFVLRATARAYKESYRKEMENRRNMLRDTPPNTTRMDLDSSASRIRAWQLFYGSVEATSSTPSNGSSRSEKELSSNSNERNRIRQPTISFESPDESGISKIQSLSEDESRYYHAYPDVADDIDGGTVEHIEELRNQLPWSYTHQVGEAKLKGASRSKDQRPMEVAVGRKVRIRSTSSGSGTEM